MIPLNIGIIGIDHRHIYGMLQGMLDAGSRCAGWWTSGSPKTMAGFVERFPGLPRFDGPEQLLEDPGIDLILIADIPDQRADWAVAAMRAGKDVMVDKPGCISHRQLDALRRTVGETARIWSVDFSERFEVPAVGKALRLVNEGAIGDVVQTVGLGPHRLNSSTRPDWFFDPARFGGILCDIASHQIDQFLVFTGSQTAQIIHAAFDNFSDPSRPQFQDFGEILLAGAGGRRGYIRVDWFTPDALPTWGDGRFFILGTGGTIELRKYVDIGGRPGTDHVMLVNGDRCEHIDASTEPLTYFQRLSSDIRQRTQTAMTQEHCFTVMELAIEAQRIAENSVGKSAPPGASR